MKIAIVGGGAAGLAAAWRLVNLGAEVTVFERGAEVGGRMRSEVLDGCVADIGAQLYGNGFTALFGLAREVGAEQLLVRSPGHDGLYRDGRIYPITYGSVSSMVTSGALPTLLKLKLGASYVPFLLRAGELNAGNLAGSANAQRFDVETVAAWGRRELGHEFVELLAYPLLGAYYGSSPERTSTALYHALAKAGLDVGVYAVRGGNSELMRAIAAACVQRGATIRRGAEVGRVRADASHAAVDDEEFDAAVLAVPAPLVPSLADLPESVASWLQGVEFAPSAVMAVVLKRRVNLGMFGLSIVRREASANDLVAICVPEHKLGGLVPADRGLLICLSAPAQSAAMLADPQHAVQRMLNAVEAVLPGTRHDVLRVKLFRHPFGYPVFYPGYLRHLHAFPAAAMPVSLKLAGDYLVSPTVDGAIRTGMRAANELGTRFGLC